MHYYIDGYNLLFRRRHEDDLLAKQRQDMIAELNQILELLQLEVTIVFDSQFQQSESSRSHFQHLEILFSAYGETADNCILEEIKSEKNPREVVVVTSDKKLAWFARRCSAKTESVEQFMEWLEKRYKNKLRHQKEGIKRPKDIPQEEKKREVRPEKKPSIPTSSASPEECFDYYLDQFQTQFEALPPVRKASPDTPTTKKEKTKKGKRKEIPKADPKGNDLERWQRIFEQNSGLEGSDR